MDKPSGHYTDTFPTVAPISQRRSITQVCGSLTQEGRTWDKWGGATLTSPSTTSMDTESPAPCLPNWPSLHVNAQAKNNSG
ncbi:hypothetical protein E2C01_101207 [Portunus trituberculatus]|uniref:Uncharacterized protein n=1 Tax=Portunus trituberculatus TaxID=210409 RepID=A0A5B7K547_PORTR|nr:hypothetical protein [Portunus trituberculatus]